MRCATGFGATVYQDVLISAVPHVKQRWDFCGEACAEMYLRKLGKTVNQNDVFNQAGLDPTLARGCHTPELARALERIGFKIGAVWLKVDAHRADEELEALWRELHADLSNGVPSIVCMHVDSPPDAEHFRLVLGYDAKSDEVIYHEPALDQAAYQRIKRSEFLQRWPLKYDENSWTVVRFRLEPGQIKTPVRAAGFTNADYAQHLMRLYRVVDRGAFTVVLQRPFVVIGDEEPAVVKQRTEQTIQWAVEHLKKLYFDRDPREILDIWLFRDDESYRTHTRKFFGETPSTPFGYYSAKHGALIMNIGTGGGTLVHELVHPFMRSNFPQCPAWFNEGMASLYEQSSEKDGQIHGETNWRLEGLQKAIRAGRVPTFRVMTAATDSEFYGQTDGTRYAQARYLCYYLQEKGKLVDYYHAFCARHEQDPTGYQTLVKTLGESDMAAFQKKWETSVLDLHFP